MRTSGQLGGSSPDPVVCPLFAGATAAQPADAALTAGSSLQPLAQPGPPAAGERSRGAGSPVEGGPPGSHRGQVGQTTRRSDFERGLDRSNFLLLCWRFRFGLFLFKLILVLFRTPYPLRDPTPGECTGW